MGVLQSYGYNVHAPNAADNQGYLSPHQEILIETSVSKRAICLVNGLEKVESFLDGDLTLGDKFTFDGTTYSCVTGRVISQDFRFQTRVRRNSEGHVIYDPTTVCLPTMVSSSLPCETQTSSNSLGRPHYIYYSLH